MATITRLNSIYAKKTKGKCAERIKDLLANDNVEDIRIFKSIVGEKTEYYIYTTIKEDCK